jgi:hypothetical protein
MFKQEALVRIDRYIAASRAFYNVNRLVIVNLATQNH